MAHELDELAQLHIQRRLTIGERLHRRLHALDIAAVVRAPDVDHGQEAPVDLRLVIGDVGGEIGVGAIRLLERAINVVAKIRGAEEGLLPILPIIGQLPLGGRQAPLVDDAPRRQVVDGRANEIPLPAARQGPLGEEDRMDDVEGGQIPADHVHHGVDGGHAHILQPLALGLAQQTLAKARRQRRAHGLQVIAGIEPLGDLADVMPQRLAVAQISGPGQHIHLRARVVDIVFAGHLEAREIEQARQRVAKHRPAPMAHMHGPGGIGGDIFHIDFLRRGQHAPPEGRALSQRRAQHGREDGGLEADVDEAGPRDFSLIDLAILRQRIGDFGGELARVGEAGLGLAGVDHGRVGGEIPMGGIPGGLHHEAGEIEIRRQAAIGHDAPQDHGHAGLEVGEDIHGSAVRVFSGRLGRAGSLAG